MTVLLTGATGLVGARLLPRLIEAGLHCRALVRGGKEGPASASHVAGDLLYTSTLTPAVEGISAVVHLAAVLLSSTEN